MPPLSNQKSKTTPEKIRIEVPEEGAPPQLGDSGGAAGAKAPGRIPKDLFSYSTELLAEFAGAGEEAIFFNEDSSTAQLRSLERFMSKTREKLIGQPANVFLQLHVTFSLLASRRL